MRFFRLVVEVTSLFAAVSIFKLKSSNQKRARGPVYHYRGTTVDVAQKELFNGPKPRLNVVTWSSISRKPKSLQSIKWRLFVDLRFLTSCWISDHEDWEAGELTREVRFQQRLKKLFNPHVGRRLLPDDKEAPPHVYLAYQTSRRASEILANHQGVSSYALKAAIHNMELRAKRRTKNRLAR